MLILLPMVTTGLVAGYMGRLIDRRGVKSVLRWGHGLWAVLPAFWILARPQTALAWLGLAAVVGALGSHAALLAANKLITRLRASEDVPMYAAVSACVGSAAGGLGPLVAGFVLEALQGSSWEFAGREFGGFQVLFVASLVLRALATQLIRLVPDVPPEPAPAPADATESPAG